MARQVLVTGNIDVVVVDDYVPYRRTVAQLLEGANGIHVAGMGGSAEEALRLAAELEPDILLLDVDMPGDGLSVIRTVVAADPRVVVAMLTASSDEEHIARAIKAGARAYILKGLSGRELAEVIRQIHEGQTYVTPTLVRKLTPELLRILRSAR